MTRHFILAAHFREAALVARRLGLDHGTWVYVRTGRELWGTRGATVYYTPCWTDFAKRDMQEITTWLESTAAELLPVDCP